MKICRTCNLEKEDSAFSGRQRVCKPCRCEANRAYYWENREARIAYAAAYRKENPEYAANTRPRVNERRKQRYHSDPLFKLTLLLRNRVTDALAGKSKKSARTTELLGAPWVWVEAYLEEQFQPGMSWENHGPVWHIDHIRPCSSFDLADPEQQRMCFHWTNLQPLFALDNFRKSDTYDPQNA